VSVPAAFLGVVLIWATTPLAIKWSSEGAGFLFGVAARMVLGVLVCLVLVALMRRRLPWHPLALRTYLAAGLGLWAAMSSVYWAAQFIPSGLISVVFGLTPVVTALMAALWLREPALTPPRLAGMALSLLGLWVVFGHGMSLTGSWTLGLGGVLLSVLMHSASAVWVKRIDAGLHPIETTTGGLLVAVPLFVLDWALWDGQVPTALPPRAGWSIVYLAVFGSALGFILYYHLLRRIQASQVALITLLTPVLALMLGQALNGETVSARMALGSGAILAGLALFHWGEVFLSRKAAAV
jgi:drug/metabolite transporter (DMT)-like permease